MPSRGPPVPVSARTIPAVGEGLATGAPPAGDGEVVGVGDALGLAEGDALGLGVGDSLGLGDGDGLGLCMGEGLGLGMGEGLGVGMFDGYELGVGVGMSDGYGVGDPCTLEGSTLADAIKRPPPSVKHKRPMVKMNPNTNLEFLRTTYDLRSQPGLRA